MNATQTPAAIMIVWNGCDSYIELDRAESRGYNIDGNTLYTCEESFEAFPAVEVDVESLPVIDGEPDLDGVLGTESGKYYLAA